MKIKEDHTATNEDSSNMEEYLFNIWKEDFRPVAQRLLERIQANQS